MTDAQIIQMARDAGSIDSDGTILTVYAAIRSATKDEDSMICDALQPEGNEDAYLQGAWETGTLDCAEAIRASK